jgi:hypothetical protein
MNAHKPNKGENKMEITGPQLNTFMTVLKDLTDHDIKITDWDTAGNVEVEWYYRTKQGHMDCEREWVYSADGLLETIDKIKEAQRLAG